MSLLRSEADSFIALAFAATLSLYQREREPAGF